MIRASYRPDIEMAKQRRNFLAVALLALFALTCVTASAQSEPTRQISGIEIVKVKWEKQVRMPRNFDPSTVPDNGIFSTMESRTAVPGSTQAPNGDAVRRDAAERSAALAPVDYFPKTPGRMPVVYVYSLKARNTGSKPVLGLAWDYLFLDANTNAVLGDHQVLSYAKIAEGKTVNLQAAQRTPPITIIKAQGSDSAKANAKRNRERVVIQCVMYSDGTTWHNPVGRAGACEVLTRNQPSANQKRKDSRR